MIHIERKKLPAGVESKARVIEIKADALAEDGTIEGYLSVFGNIDGAGDIVMPGAFKASLAKGRQIPMLYQHDADDVLGLWASLVEDNYGLKVKGRVIDTALGQDVLKLARGGVKFGLSIGYETIRYEIDESVTTPRGWPIRKLIELDLWEGSIVTFPCNEICGVDSVKAQTHVSLAPLAAELKRILSPDPLRALARDLRKI